MSSQDIERVTFRDALSSALRYWEPRRLIYNGALLLVVVAELATAPAGFASVLNAEFLLALFILAVMANVAYCAAYVPDIALQFSSFRAGWLRARWLLLTLGTLFASAIAYLMVETMFLARAGA